jgi:16S rRNA A1518/A1519 N6-dimethyltransferase RsmA/KsgA/DIM1 with predicted DNA glycosylase/AP lyase activity
MWGVCRGATSRCVRGVGRALIRTERGLTLRKSLGQHLLVRKDILHTIVRAAAIEPHEHVLEIGPGTGNLTILLLEKAGAVTAVELDDDLFDLLTARVERL